MEASITRKYGNVQKRPETKSRYLPLAEIRDRLWGLLGPSTGGLWIDINPRETKKQLFPLNWRDGLDNFRPSSNQANELFCRLYADLPWRGHAEDIPMTSGVSIHTIVTEWSPQTNCSHQYMNTFQPLVKEELYFRYKWARDWPLRQAAFAQSSPGLGLQRIEVVWDYVR